MSAPLVTVTLDGKTSVNEVASAISERLVEAASRAAYEAAEFHAERARDNVWRAYTTAGFPKISLGYAKWLLETFDPKYRTLSESEREQMAEEYVSNKQSMILTGELLEGIGAWPSRRSDIDKNIVYATAVSKARHSKSLEVGYLFGKRRPGRERPFFTVHLPETKAFMIDTFMAHLNGGMRE